MLTKEQRAWAWNRLQKKHVPNQSDQQEYPLRLNHAARLDSSCGSCAVLVLGEHTPANGDENMVSAVFTNLVAMHKVLKRQNSQGLHATLAEENSQALQR